MAFTALRGMKPFPQLMFAAFIILVSFLAFMVIGLIVAVPLFGMDSLLDMPNINDMNDPQSVNLMKFLQVVQSFGLFIIPPLVLAVLYHGSIKIYLHLDKRANAVSLLLVLILTLVAAPFINFIGEMNMRMIFPEWLSGVEQWMKSAEEQAAQLTEAFLKVEGVGGLLFNLFMIALLPAIGEELLFRGVIQRIFTNMTKNHHWGIWISAILFSSLHLQFYGFVPRMLLGVAFGYLLLWSGSMWLPIVAHFLNNALAVLALYFIDKRMLSPKLEEYGATSESYYLAGISLLLVALFMYMVKKENRENELNYAEPEAPQ